MKTQIDSNELSRILQPLSEDLKSKLFIETTYSINNRIPNTSPQLSYPDSYKCLAINTQESYMPILRNLTEKYSHLNAVEEFYQKIPDITASPNISMIYSNWDKYNYSENTELLFLSLMIISTTDESIKRSRSYSKAVKPIETELKRRRE